MNNNRRINIARCNFDKEISNYTEFMPKEKLNKDPVSAFLDDISQEQKKKEKCKSSS